MNPCSSFIWDRFENIFASIVPISYLSLKNAHGSRLVLPNLEIAHLHKVVNTLPMSLLSFNSPGPQRNKILQKISFGAIGVIAIVLVATTLAANININGSAPVEFGQGVSQTTSCDDSIMLTPISTFENASGAGSFNLSSITLSDLDTSDQTESSPSGCSGKTFSIKLYGNTGDALASYTITHDGSSFSSRDGSISNQNFDSQELSTVTLSLANANVPADLIYRITLETSKVNDPSLTYISACNTGSTHRIGDLTHDGYVFLTPNCPDNPTGKYFVVSTGSLWLANGNLRNSPWCNDDIFHNFNATAIGAGEGNTAAWLGLSSTCASYQFDDFLRFNQANGGDWFIPSKDEISSLHTSLNTVNITEWDVPGNWYWTSSEIDSGSMWMFDGDGITEDLKMNYSRVVPVRSFSP